MSQEVVVRPLYAAGKLAGGTGGAGVANDVVESHVPENNAVVTYRGVVEATCCVVVEATYCVAVVVEMWNGVEMKA